MPQRHSDRRTIKAESGRDEQEAVPGAVVPTADATTLTARTNQRWLVSALLIAIIIGSVIVAHYRIQSHAALVSYHAASKNVSTVVPVCTDVAVAEDAFELPRRFVGLVVPQRTVSLGFEINGRVASADVSIGDRVRRGDVLATLYERRIEANLAEARAGLKRASAILALKETEVRRKESLRDRGVATQQTLDEARSNLQTARADVASAEARIRSLEIDLEDTTLRAPFDGEILSVDFDLGDVVSPGRNILRMSSTGHPEAHIGIPVQIAEGFKPGMSATVIHRGITISAEVKAAVSRVNTLSQTMDVVVLLPPGIAAIEGERVAIVSSQIIEQRGFWVPLGALVSDLKGLFAVQIAKETEGKQLVIARAPVVIHHTDGERAFVSGGLRAGDRIVTEGTNRVSPGQRVVLATFGVDD